jgi:hypothetical protein
MLCAPLPLLSPFSKTNETWDRCTRFSWNESMDLVGKNLDLKTMAGGYIFAACQNPQDSKTTSSPALASKIDTRRRYDSRPSFQNTPHTLHVLLLSAKTHHGAGMRAKPYIRSKITWKYQASYFIVSESSYTPSHGGVQRLSTTSGDAYTNPSVSSSTSFLIIHMILWFTKTMRAINVCDFWLLPSLFF